MRVAAAPVPAAPASRARRRPEPAAGSSPPTHSPARRGRRGRTRSTACAWRTPPSARARTLRAAAAAARGDTVAAAPPSWWGWRGSSRSGGACSAATIGTPRRSPGTRTSRPPSLFFEKKYLGACRRRTPRIGCPSEGTWRRASPRPLRRPPSDSI